MALIRFLSNIDANKSRLLAIVAILLGALALTACGGGGSSNSSLGESQGGSGDTPIEDEEEETETQTGVSIGSGTGVSFVEGVIGSDTTELQAGGQVNLIVNFVDSQNEPFDSVVTVNFTSECFANGIAGFSEESIMTNAGGFGTTRYIANGCSGEDIVTATAVVDGELLTARTTLTVEPDTVLNITFEGASETFLNLEGTGGIETSILTFRLVGALNGNIVGESVSFSIQGDEGGARIADGQESNVTGTDGTVTTVLQSGTTATNIQVVAIHDATQVTASSDSIVISSGRPIQESFSLTQSSFNPFGTFNTDNIEVDINILVGDQFSNDIADGTSINFFAECGVIEPSCEIGENSGCSVVWRSNTSNQMLNGNRCSILAFTEGVETFTDLNGNFVFETTDFFDADRDDLPEPFVDNNENGVYDEGERFVDTANGVAGSYDGPNGDWDGLCLFSSFPLADCSGEDSAVIFAQGLVTITCDGLSLTPIPGGVGAGVVDLATTNFIDLTTEDSVVVQALVQDGCTAGNPPGEGITLTFAGEDIEVGEFELNVGGDLTEPLLIQNTIATDGVLSQDAILALEVSFPDGDESAFSWIVGDLCPTATVFNSSPAVNSVIDVSGADQEIEVRISEECNLGDLPLADTRVIFEASGFDLIDAEGERVSIIEFEIAEDDLFRLPAYSVVASSNGVSSAGTLTLFLFPDGGNITEFTWTIND